MKNSKNSWSIKDALHTYQIPRWGEGYFGINKDGNLIATPNKDQTQIDIKAVIDEMVKEGVEFPAVIRFHDILRGQVKNLNESFEDIIQEADYKGSYCGVFPIKVNQLKEVIEEIVDAGQDYLYGLEAGSKSELLTVLAHNSNNKSLTILNGYKDREYIELAVLGALIGKNIILVIEKISEATLALEVMDNLGVEVNLGVRSKLNSKSSGLWSNSSGEFAKFGLTATEIIKLVDFLKERNKLHLLKLFHFHAGSQIPDIRTIKECLIEGARLYAGICKIGAPLEYFDAGGGVGINYDGSRSNNPSSTNYTLKDYIGDVVYNLKEICDLEGVAHPDIVTETGRAITAHHSCVITNVFGSIEVNKYTPVDTTPNKNDHHLVKNIKELYEDLNLSNYQDVYNDACLIKDESIQGFKLGVIDMKSLSFCETIFWNICHQIINMTKEIDYVPKEIKNLSSTLADKYLCNFSLFQSAPDSWAINQILPIVPITRLNEAPTKECTLADITCDSDGKITHFLGQNGHRHTLPIHRLSDDEDYYIGLFLTGAYQDIMGDMHNLFGRLNEVHVFTDKTDSNNFYIEKIIHGNTSAEVLEIMQYNPNDLSRRVKDDIDSGVKSGFIKPRDGVKLADFYDKMLHGYTYLTKN